MKSKKEIKRIYDDCKSRNRIDDELIQQADWEIGSLQARGYEIKTTRANIVDMAYDLQKTQKSEK